MRKPRDYDSELKVLAGKAKALRERRVRELGALVMACKADALDVELLAGALLYAAVCDDMITRGEWRQGGAAFFQRAGSSERSSGRKRSGAAPRAGDGAPAASEAGAP